MARQVHSPAVRADYHNAIPLNRYGTEQEIAAAVAFLCSEAASYIGARGRGQERQRMAHGLAADDLALGHHGLRRAQPALPVLEVHERQDPGLLRARRGATAGAVVLDDRPYQVGRQRARHGAGGPRVEIRPSFRATPTYDASHDGCRARSRIFRGSQALLRAPRL